MRVAKTIELNEHTERELRVLAKRRTVEARLQQRALVVLLAAEGRQNKDIAVEVGLDRRQVALWRERFRSGGIDALRKDAPRSGRPATIRVPSRPGPKAMVIPGCGQCVAPVDAHAYPRGDCRDQGREWLVDLVALTLELKASAFNRQTDARIRSATGLLRTIKLHAGDDISIELQGQPVALPAHLRRVFAVSGPGNPAVAYEGEVSLLNWDILSLLAPKIGELIGAVETANALETVVTSLARRLGSASLTTPSDADYSAVFEESTDRVAEVRRAQRTGVTGLAFALRPIVAALLGEDVLLDLLRATAEEPDPDAIVAYLSGFSDRLPSSASPEHLVNRALEGTPIAAMRDELQIGFAEFNRVLIALGGEYAPIQNPQGLVTAMASHLVQCA